MFEANESLSPNPAFSGFIMSDFASIGMYREAGFVAKYCRGSFLS
jgi:hypothetical protein